MKKITKVNCDVETCKHNDDKQCCLEELDISCTCDGEECEEIEETICNKFEKEASDDDSEELEYDIIEEDVEEDEIEYDNDDDFEDDEEAEYNDDDEIEEEYSEEITEEYIELEEEKDL